MALGGAKVVKSALLTLLVLFCGFSFGVYYGQVSYEPKTVTEYVEVETPIYIEKEVPVVRTVVEEIIIEKSVYKELSDWATLGELIDFLDEDDTDSRLILVANKDGVFKFNNQCEDVAFQLRGRAFNIGKRLETETLSRSESLKYAKHIKGDVSGLGVNDGHLLVKAVVGNGVYFIEPSNDEVWLAYYLD